VLSFIKKSLIEALAKNLSKIVVDEFKGTVQFLDKKTEGSAPKKTVKVTTPAVEVASDFDDVMNAHNV
jgi:hypothetical protein